MIQYVCYLITRCISVIFFAMGQRKNLHIYVRRLGHCADYTKFDCIDFLTLQESIRRLISLRNQGQQRRSNLDYTFIDVVTSGRF